VYVLNGRTLPVQALVWVGMLLRLAGILGARTAPAIGTARKDPEQHPGDRYRPQGIGG
jgi:hypothetical protein